MRYSTWFTCTVQAIAALVIICSGISAQSQHATTAIDKAFSDRVQAYIAIQKTAEKSLPPLKSSKDEAEIAAHQLALRAKIIEARPLARQGDIFTKEVSEHFRKTIRAVFKAPGGEIVRRTIVEGDATKPFAIQVNGIYPDASPVQTTPPTILMALPELPMELRYRFVDRSLVLLDNKTNLIVDFLHEVLP
jgi:hypothetical protein